MRVFGVNDTASTTALRRRAADRPETEASAPAESRALMVIQPAARSDRQFPMSRYPAAPFLAHLIANRMQAPQTRALRRADPEEAIAVYAARLAPRTPRVISKTA